MVVAMLTMDDDGGGNAVIRCRFRRWCAVMMEVMTMMGSDDGGDNDGGRGG